MERLNWPLMENNISEEDLKAVIKLLKGEDLILTQSVNVKRFEEAWSEWLGVRYSVFVNSGSSANLLTLSALKLLCSVGEVIVPPLTWVSDIAALIHCGFSPVFADIDPLSLGMETERVLRRISSRTKAVFLSHILGYNALTEKLVNELKTRGIYLIEDVCESHGALFRDKKCGTFGLVSNFSFYYAHHLSTIEGGMVCTDSRDVYEIVRMLRSHGMVRESSSEILKSSCSRMYPDLSPDFIFLYPAYNFRSTEINAVLGLSQLSRLNDQNERRTEHLTCFLSHLDSNKYVTNFKREGASSYALTLVLKEKDMNMRDRVEKTFLHYGVEFRRGLSGGGNQLRQPYLQKYISKDEHLNYPATEHVHFFGWYIGNYPGLQREKILRLCDLLNRL